MFLNSDSVSAVLPFCLILRLWISAWCSWICLLGISCLLWFCPLACITIKCLIFFFFNHWTASALPQLSAFESWASTSHDRDYKEIIPKHLYFLVSKRTLTLAKVNYWKKHILNVLLVVCVCVRACVCVCVLLGPSKWWGSIWLEGCQLCRFCR